MDVIYATPTLNEHEIVTKMKILCNFICYDVCNCYVLNHSQIYDNASQASNKS